MTLQSRHDVVSVIARATGLTDLRPDAHDNFEIVIGGRLSCFFHCTDSDTLGLDMSIRAARLDGHTDPDILAGMLKVNTGSTNGCFALEPGTGRAFWRQRLQVAEHSPASLIAAIKDFLRGGVDLDATSDGVLARAVQLRAARERAVSNDTTIRL